MESQESSLNKSPFFVQIIVYRVQKPCVMERKIQKKKKQLQCVWSKDKHKKKSKRCVNNDNPAQRCSYEKISVKAMVGAPCPYNAKTMKKCAESKENCQQCTPCSKMDAKSTKKTGCYMAVFKKRQSRCVFNYLDKNAVEKRDNCEPPAQWAAYCPLVPGTFGMCNTVKYVVENIPEGATALEAVEICLEEHNSFPATITNECDMTAAVEAVGVDPLPMWTGKWSDAPNGAFSFIDGTTCPVWHNGSPCRGCTEQSLWQNRRPIAIEKGGSHCVRLVAEEATETNDIDCDDKLFAVLCNCDNTASTGTYSLPYPYNV